MVRPNKRSQIAKWLLGPSEINWDNMKNIRRETIRNIRNRRKESLKDKIDELPTNSKNNNSRDLYRGIN
jgi:hypothetical protein